MYRLFEHLSAFFVSVYLFVWGIANLKNDNVPKIIDWIVSIMYTHCVFCKAGTEYLNVIWINFVIQWVKLYFIASLLKI